MRFFCGTRVCRHFLPPKRLKMRGTERPRFAVPSKRLARKAYSASVSRRQHSSTSRNRSCRLAPNKPVTKNADMAR